MNERAKRADSLGIGTLVLAPVLMQAIFVLRQLLRLLTLGNDTTYPEGSSIASFLTSFHTGMLYTSPLSFPFNHEMYGPLFYLIGATAAWLTHGNILLTTEIMRAISLVSFVGSAGLVGLLAWGMERTRGAFIVGVILSLACGWAVPFCVSARPDSLSIFLILAGLAVYCFADGRGSLLFWAGVLGSLACLTKLSVAPVLVALVLDSAFAKRFKGAGTIVVGSLCAPLIAGIFLGVRHEPFWLNVTLVGHLVMGGQTVFRYVRVAAGFNKISVCVCMLALCGLATRWKESRYRVLILAGILEIGATLLSLANPGWWINYFILPWFLVVPFVPAAISWISRGVKPAWLVFVGIAAAEMVLVVYQKNTLLAKPPQTLEGSRVANLEMLGGSPYLEVRSKNPELLDPWFFHQLAMEGVVSLAPVTKEIDNEKFDLILLTSESPNNTMAFHVIGFAGISMWTPEALEAMRARYRPLCKTPNMLALVPKDRSVDLRTSEMAAVLGEPCVGTEQEPAVAEGQR